LSECNNHTPERKREQKEYRKVIHSYLQEDEPFKVVLMRCNDGLLHTVIEYSLNYLQKVGFGQIEIKSYEQRMQRYA
jgi:hypothetical protein